MNTCNGPNPPQVLIRRVKSALHLILNRPEAINSLQCLRRDEHKDLAEVYESDLSVARFLMTQHNFREGVRARLIDKDDQPHWDPESFEEATRVLDLQTNLGQPS